MKTLKEVILKAVSLLFLILFFAFGTQFSTIAQSEVAMSKFMIHIDYDSNQINLTCLDGCKFKKLSFTLIEGDTQCVFKSGMCDGINWDKTSKYYSEYEFLVTKTSENLCFIGIRGTAWKELCFTCTSSCNQWIDQNGMVGK